MPPNLRFDRVFPSVGRIQRMSGTARRGTFAQMDAMLSTLWSAGRLDLLARVQDGSVHPMVLFDSFRSGRLEDLPTAEGVIDLAAAFAEWRAHFICSRYHAQSVRQSAQRILAVPGSDGSVSSLPQRMVALRGSMSGTARTYNLTRAAALAFLRDTVTRAHPLYRSVQGIPTLPVKRKVRPRPQTPAQLAEAAIDADTYACALAMASTGMLPKEYWEDGWERGLGYIQIHGEKRAGRERKVPDIGLCAEPRISRASFTDRLQAAGVGFSGKDMRTSFANWMEAAGGIPRTRRRIYMGHGTKDITDLYEWHEISAFLREDGDTLKQWYAVSMSRLVPQNSPHRLSRGT